MVVVRSYWHLVVFAVASCCDRGTVFSTINAPVTLHHEHHDLTTIFKFHGSWCNRHDFDSSKMLSRPLYDHTAITLRLHQDLATTVPRLSRLYHDRTAMPSRLYQELTTTLPRPYCDLGSVFKNMSWYGRSMIAVHSW